MGSKSKSYSAAIIIASLSTVANAQTLSTFESGNALFSTCTSTSALDAQYCLGFVSAVSDTAEVYESVTKRKFYCPPDGLTAGQLRDLSLQYLSNHPEQRHLAAASLVAYSFTYAFPCPK